MHLLGLLFVFAFGIVGVPAPHHGESHFCYECHDTHDPTACHHVVKCHPDQHCGATVQLEHGALKMSLGCVHDCTPQTSPIGKRGPHDHNIQCKECCTGDRCNRNLCGSYAAQIGTGTGTTTGTGGTGTGTGTGGTGTGTGTGTGGTCQDNEGDGITCSELVALNICTDTHSSSILIAKEKCPKTCGFCATDAPATAAPTTGHIDIVITQAPAPTEIVTKAPTKAPTTKAPTTQPTTVATQAPTTQSNVVTATSTHIVTTTQAPATMAPVTSAPSMAGPCVDDEMDGFLCANFDQFNFCTDTTSFAYPLNKRCPKHCGFCVAPAEGTTTTTDSNTPLMGGTTDGTTDSTFIIV